MTEDLISCSNQSLVGTNLCEARTKKSSVVCCGAIDFSIKARCVAAVAFN